jgi:hypothetical protein
MTRIKSLFTAAALSALAIAPFAFAESANPSADAAYAEMTKLLGAVPTFVKSFPKAGIAGAWAEVRDIQQGADWPCRRRADPVRLLRLRRHDGRQARRREPGGNPGSSRRVGADPALEHGLSRQPDRLRHVQEGNGRDVRNRLVACKARLPAGLCHGHTISGF